LTLVLTAATGGAAYAFFPGTHAAPVADRLSTGVITSPAAAGLLGQGSASAYDQPPAPITTAIARTPASRHPVKPKPVPTKTRTTPPVAPPSTSGGSADAFGLGLYDGKSSPAGIETAAKWLGSGNSITYAQDFIDATDWSHIDTPWQLSNWKGSPFTMVWGVPMLPCGVPETQCSTNASDYDLVANGGADSYFKTLAQNLVSSGFGTSYIRLGWEFNAGWMGWGICTEDNSALTSWAKDFVPAFRNIVTSMRSVSGANFKFIWNPIDSSNASCPGANLENFYPGDSYVDDIASDAYDGIGSDTSDSARWADLLSGTNADGWTAVTPAPVNGQAFKGYGLNWLAAFGRAHGKTVGLPEWGLNTSGTNGGGGDDGYFVTQMASWIKAHATGPAIFWNFGDGTLPLNIPGYTSGDTPDATAVFKSAFAAGG
jgi:Glycosyl hydrolase family 26